MYTIIFGVICIIGLLVYANNKKSIISAGYPVKLEEVVNYKQNSVIVFKDITIKYLKSMPWTYTSAGVGVSGSDIFEVSSVGGKKYEVSWGTGTGELPGPTYLATNSGCYELQINVLEGRSGLQNMTDSLVLYKAEENKCDNEWAKDLR